MKRKILCIMTAVIMLAACGREQEREFEITTRSLTSETENSDGPAFVTDAEIGGWTMEQLADSIYLCGHKLALPSKISELDAALVLTGEYYPASDETMSILSCGKETVALISFKGDCTNDPDSVITNITYGLSDKMPEFNIMGITESSSPDDVKAILGEPNFTQDDGGTYRYVFSDTKQVMFSFNEDLSGIDFYYVTVE